MLAVKALLAKILKSLESTEWTALGNGISYKRHHGVLFIDCYGTSKTITTSYQVLGTLPVGYRPTKTSYAVMGTNNQYCGVAYISQSGTIGAKVFTGTTSYYWFQFAIPLP